MVSGNGGGPDATIEGARRNAGARPHAILIVDDEPAILESLELTLGSDYRVFSAASGEEGLAILAPSSETPAPCA